MNSKIFTPRFIFISTAIIIAAIMRLIPHIPNFTPVAAIALFGGAYLNRKHLAYLIPFAALFISDMIIGFHSYMIAVYVSFAITVTIGILIGKNVKVLTVLSGSIISSILFYLITNFAVWYGSPYYAQNISGLMQCYTMAIPFFNNGIIGDLFYSSVLFGGFYLVKIKYPVLAK